MNMSETEEHHNTSDQINRQILDELIHIRRDFQQLNTRVEACENSRPPPSWTEGEQSLDHRPPVSTTDTRHPDTSAAAIGGTRDTPLRTFEVQNAFTEVREKHTGCKLPADLLFTTARKNVKADDLPVFQVLSKVSKYCETGIKAASRPANRETVEDCLIVFNALMRYIQDEGVQLVINKNYDKDWASQYRAIMGGQTDVREEHINAMDRVATILKHRSTPPPHTSRGRSRMGRTRGYRGFQSTRGSSHYDVTRQTRGGGDWQTAQNINNNDD